MYSPWMKDPSLGALVMSSLLFFVTSTARHILSSGHSFFLAIDCIIAVRKDCGLNKPPSHTALGREKSELHASNS